MYVKTRPLILYHIPLEVLSFIKVSRNEIYKGIRTPGNRGPTHHQPQHQYDHIFIVLSFLGTSSLTKKNHNASKSLIAASVALLLSLSLQTTTRAMETLT